MRVLFRSVLAAVAAVGVVGIDASINGVRAIDLKGKTLVVAIHNRAPWGYRDKDGEVVGYHPDIVRAALEPLGVKSIDFAVADFGAMIPGLMAKRFDIIASGVAITPQRCEQVLFGEPDLSAGDGLLVPKGNPKNIHSYEDFVKNPKLRLAGVRGTDNAKSATRAGVPDDKLQLFPDNESMISAMLANRVDAATMSTGSAIGFLESGKLNGVERAIPFRGYIKPDGERYKMATAVVFSRDEAELRDAFNARLAQMKADGTVDRLMKKYGFTQDEAPPKDTTAQICGTSTAQ